MVNVFIDGEVGTTGLQIRERLAAQPDDVRVLSIDPEKRKDASARKELMRAADVAILCLPDDAAREAVALIDELEGEAPRVIDASTAHRTHPDWVYGFAELAPGHADAIADARKVANPGCYATGAIAIIRPLVEAGHMPADFPFSINAVSGYTGGGKSMIAAYDEGSGPNFELYGLALDHKHLPEITTHCGLTRPPIFIPSVAAFPQGMLVSIPLDVAQLASRPTDSDIVETYRAYYAGEQSQVKFHHVEDGEAAYLSKRLRVDPAEGSDRMEVWLFNSNDETQFVIVARFDNLGKGAAGAAVQNLRLMTGH